MWYMPYRRVRGVVTIFVALALVAVIIVLAFRFWPGSILLNPRHLQQMSQLHVDAAMMLSFAALIVAGFATIMGLNLAAENDGHLELAWTLPESREKYALGVFAVDFVTIVAMQIGTVLVAVVVMDIFVGHQALYFNGGTFGRALLDATFPMNIYAWIAALSASIKRNRATVAGIFWPSMFGIAALQLIPEPTVHALARAVNTINPITLYSAPKGIADSTLQLLGLLVTAALLAAAALQWRRLET